MQALQRLETEVFAVSRDQICPALTRLSIKIDHLTGHTLRQHAYLNRLQQLIPPKRWDIAWVDSGNWCGPRVVALLRNHADKVCLLNNDDPTGPREPHAWRSLRR